MVVSGASATGEYLIMKSQAEALEACILEQK